MPTTISQYRPGHNNGRHFRQTPSVNRTVLQGSNAPHNSVSCSTGMVDLGTRRLVGYERHSLQKSRISWYHRVSWPFRDSVRITLRADYRTKQVLIFFHTDRDNNNNSSVQQFRQFPHQMRQSSRGSNAPHYGSAIAQKRWVWARSAVLAQKDTAFIKHNVVLSSAFTTPHCAPTTVKVFCTGRIGRQ